MISPRAMASICCSPPDSVPASCVRRSCSAPKIAYIVGDPGVGLGRGDPGHRAREAQRLVDPQVGEDPAALRDVDDAAARDLVRRACPSATCRRDETSPAISGSIPDRARSVVVLPAPFAPSRATISPSLTSRSMSNTTGSRP